jgi:metal-responsive CopG/Arc/MetJ family transcriptional regulator
MSVFPEASAPMSSILPPKGEVKTRGSTVHLPDEMWDRLDEISAETKAEDLAGKGYSRNEVIQQFLRWAMREYDAERRAAKGKRKAE